MLGYVKKRSNTITVASSSSSNSDGGNNSSTTTYSTTPSWLSQGSPNASISGLLSYISLPSISRHRSTLSLLVALVLVLSTWVLMFAGPGAIEDMHAGQGDTQTAINFSMKNGNNWAPKWMHAHFQAAKGAPGDTKKQILQENYTEKDGLLYFAAAAPPKATSGVGAAYASMHPQRHPILYLIEKAERDWDALLRRQSTTLEEAVSEYKLRYSRSPPKGFDNWWQFAKDNHVQLVDEYNTIMRDIEPYLALSPETFRKRAKQLLEPDFRASKHTFTTTVQDGAELIIGGPDAGSHRAKEFTALIKSIAQYLPTGMHATFANQDGPKIFVSGENHARYTEYARQGRYLTEQEANDTGDVADHPGWSIACPPGSNWRKSRYVESPSPHSFISDVETSSDICKHPEVASQHGFFSWIGPRPWLLYPVFTFAHTALHRDILATPLEQYHFSVGPDLAWEDKIHNKLLWRGSTTGVSFHRWSQWRSSQRARFVLTTNEQEGHRFIHSADEDGALHGSVEDAKDFNERVFDTGFTGQPHQCSSKDGTCDAMKRAFSFKKGMEQKEANQYRYIFDMDGNGWSGRFHKLMMSNSAILKSTVMPEWYQNRIMPWVHYIPVKVDYTDLYDIMSFFVGGTDGQMGHDELGARIARQGQEWTKSFWREVDMQAYMLRVLLEYARLLERTEEEPHRFDYD